MHSSGETDGIDIRFKGFLGVKSKEHEGSNGGDRGLGDIELEGDNGEGFIFADGKELERGEEGHKSSSSDEPY